MVPVYNVFFIYFTGFGLQNIFSNTKNFIVLSGDSHYLHKCYKCEIGFCTVKAYKKYIVVFVKKEQLHFIQLCLIE